MICPRDNTALTPRTYGELQLHICELCHGIWFQSGDMKHLKTHKKKSGETLVDGRPEVQHKACDKASTCPVDGKQSMKQVVINNVHVDICMKHRGVWLDGGELDLIIQNQKGKVSGTGEKSIEAALEVTDCTGGFEWFGDVLVDSAHIGAEVAVEAGKTVLEVIAGAADFIDF